MTRALGLLGYPLSHSFSPAIQQAALDHFNLPIQYHLWPAPAERLAAEVDKLRGGLYLGANVTVPHKQAVIALLDDLDSLAREIGAVNTIVKAGERLTGHNTDADGFMRSLKEMASFEAAGKFALVLGAGGAARAAVFSLAKERVASLAIANRTFERAVSLAEDARGLVAGVDAVPLDGNAAVLREASAGADLIVNATSMGMRYGDAQGRSPLPSNAIPADALVCDMVYTPADTPLLQEARKAGARTLGGLSMLVFQGAAAFELWTRKEAPIEVMFAAGKKALAEALDAR